MEIEFHKKALKDIDYWKKSGNETIMNRISELLEDIKLHPFYGKGKPEPLKHQYAKLWSRRITQEHRLVYKVEDGMIRVLILSMRYHYSK